MFTDTPKLQPISTSRKNDKKVPSNNGNQSNSSNHTTGGNNIMSKPAIASSTASKQDFIKTVAEIAKGTTQDAQPNDKKE